MAAQLTPGDLSEAAWQALAGQWWRWLRALAAGSFAASLDASSGRLCLLGQPAGAAQRASVHALVDAVYGSMQVGLLCWCMSAWRRLQRAPDTARMQEEDEVMRQHRALSSAVEAALKRTRIKLQNMQRQAAMGERADATKKLADLIMAALHSIPPGATSVQVGCSSRVLW